MHIERDKSGGMKLAFHAGVCQVAWARTASQAFAPRRVLHTLKMRCRRSSKEPPAVSIGSQPHTTTLGCCPLISSSKTVVACSVPLPLSWINNSQMVFPRHDHGVETPRAWMKFKGGLPDSGGIETSRLPCRINRIHQHFEHGDLQ